MKNEFYSKLVDLYAGDELSTELKDELESAALADPELSHDMLSLKTTVQLLREGPEVEFSEDSFQRILLKMYRRGVEIQTSAPHAAYMQLHLPMQG
ncbi:MAG: hypothetical protein JNJ45_06660 [Chthonomonas sp.]|nr:hypothetical protein [Chthonomonas sp.]